MPQRSPPGGVSTVWNLPGGKGGGDAAWRMDRREKAPQSSLLGSQLRLGRQAHQQLRSGSDRKAKKNQEHNFPWGKNSQKCGWGGIQRSQKEADPSQISPHS